MKVSSWERDTSMEDMLGEIQPCKNERHNLFWKTWFLFPKDAFATLDEYGIVEIRQCEQCGRVQRRYEVPENRKDVDALRHKINLHNRKCDERCRSCGEMTSWHQVSRGETLFVCDAYKAGGCAQEPYSMTNDEMCIP